MGTMLFTTMLLVFICSMLVTFSEAKGVLMTRGGIGGGAGGVRKGGIHQRSGVRGAPRVVDQNLKKKKKPKATVDDYVPTQQELEMEARRRENKRRLFEHKMSKINELLNGADNKQCPIPPEPPTTKSAPAEEKAQTPPVPPTTTSSPPDTADTPIPSDASEQALTPPSISVVPDSGAVTSAAAPTPQLQVFNSPEGERPSPTSAAMDMAESSLPSTAPPSETLVPPEPAKAIDGEPNQGVQAAVLSHTVPETAALDAPSTGSSTTANLPQIEGADASEDHSLKPTTGTNEVHRTPLEDPSMLQLLQSTFADAAAFAFGNSDDGNRAIELPPEQPKP